MANTSEITGAAKQVSWAKSVMVEAFKGKDISTLSTNGLLCYGLLEANIIIDNSNDLISGDFDKIIDTLGIDMVDSASLDDYSAYLKENYRSPSKGGNTKAIHDHVIKIEGKRFNFEAKGSKKWVFANDVVSFHFYTNQNNKNIILKGTVITHDRKGNEVIRGDRGNKPVRRTARQRPPVSRREMLS